MRYDKELTEYVMIRQKILQQLTEWIECNLEHPISIEDIAQKSGYSRRNIQLLFRNFMHVPLGEYIRKRRLCRAAILVRLSAKSMLDIALSLHFDSQQSFSREFKSYSAALPVNTATVIIGISQISSLLFNTSTAKDGV